MSAGRANGRPIAGLFVCGALVLAAALVSAQPPPSAAQSARTKFNTELLAQLAPGEGDFARALIAAERGRTQDLVEDLLAMRAQAILGAQPDAAQLLLGQAGQIATLYAAVFADSICARTVRHHAGLGPASLPGVSEAWQRYMEARSLDESGDVAGVAGALPELLAGSRAAADPYLEVRAGRLAARSLYIQGEYDSSVAVAGVALTTARRLGARRDQMKLLTTMAAAHQVRDRTDLAGGVLDEALEIARSLDDNGTVIWINNSLGNLHRARGDLEVARPRYEEALALARGEGPADQEAEILVNLGALLDAIGDLEGGLQRVEEARGVIVARGRQGTRDALTTAIMEGWLASRAGQHSRALAVLSEAIPLADALGSPDMRATTRAQLGHVYQALGRTDDALAQYDSARVVAHASGVQRVESEALFNSGALLAATGRMDEAIACQERALAIVESYEDRQHLVIALTELARVLAQRGELDPADLHLSRALGVAAEVGNPHLTAAVDEVRADVFERRGQLPQALACYDRVIGSGRRYRDQAILTDALVGRARCLQGLGDLAGADSSLAEAIEIVESLRGKQSGDAIRVGFLAKRRAAYLARVGVLEAIGGAASAEQAFLVAEKARARALLDVLSHPSLAAAVDPRLAQEERAIARTLGVLQTALSKQVASDTWDDTAIDSLEALLRAAAGEHRTTLDAIAQQFEPYTDITGNPAPDEADEIRDRVLAPDQVLVEFLVAEDATFRFVVSGGGLRLDRLPIGADSLESRVRRFREDLLASRPRGGEESGAPRTSDGHGAESHGLDRAARELHDILFGDLGQSFPSAARLMIIPDGALFYLPFGALHDGERFLIERHAVACAPSASVLDPTLRGRAPRAARSLLAIGNPQSFRSTALLAGVRGAERWRFGELPYAEEEARAIAQFFDRATVITGEAASEEAVKRAIASASHVHFATHGHLSEEEPLLSALVLAQDDDETEDGLLQAHEILGLSVPAEVVTLSACNTGIGRIAGGEGVVGLTRAFLYAGARTVLISLWEVGDRSTARLMETFYRGHARERLAPDVALQRAQVAAIQEGVAVRDWAPFVVTGSVAGASHEPARGIAAIAGAAALTAALALIATARARRAARLRRVLRRGLASGEG